MAEQPHYRYGVNHLADVNPMQFESVAWEMYKEECGSQCKKVILDELSEFRKDISCIFDHRHKGFADFIIIPAVTAKPDEMIAFASRQSKENSKDEMADVEQSTAEKEAEELYNKYCRALLLIKVGQYPTLRDMQLFDTKKYQKILGKDYRYYTLSIALASEGVGIGAFTYLRRILENIVEEVHQQCVAECNEQIESVMIDNGKQIDKDEERVASSGFNEDHYQELKFNEKISYLENNYSKVIIPPEVEPIRSKLYGVISKGIHQSSEDECLELYPSVRYIIEVFLDDKIQKRERQLKLAASIKKIQNG